jgi:hypothetical protein
VILVLSTAFLAPVSNVTSISVFLIDIGYLSVFTSFESEGVALFALMSSLTILLRELSLLSMRAFLTALPISSTIVSIYLWS